MRAPVVASTLLTLCATAAAELPNPDTRFRPGANHHVGDDSFVAAFERAPTDADTEKLRMKTHLQHVRAWLASRPATRPELAGKRAELLGYLDDYIAKGVTPANQRLPWRSPVFIDEGGAICAVGYLIERSVGRALPEQIARDHRYEFLEDIAAANRQVSDWIAASGFTLDELASIQPAYSSPNIDTWRTWDLVRHGVPDGAFDQEMEGFGEPRHITGTFKNKQLHGEWTVKSNAVVIGTGKLTRGAGTWTSFYNDGKRVLAKGPYWNSRANGAWTFYHPSGNVAAKGMIVDGKRRGEWTFYYDDKDRVPMARGRFAASGAVTGVWHHYDLDGKLLANTYGESGDIVDITADKTGVTERVHAFEDPSDPVGTIAHRLERFARGGERLYVQHSGFAKDGKEYMFDAAGFKLEHTDAGWTAADCKWSARRKKVAAADDVAWLHQMLHNDAIVRGSAEKEEKWSPAEDPGPACGAAKPVDAARSARLDVLLAAKTAIRMPTPDFIKNVLTGEQLEGPVPDPDNPDIGTDDSDDSDDSDDTDDTAWDRDYKMRQKDMRSFLATGTIGYVEWPHIDGRFDRVFRTLAGHYKWEWFASETEADGSRYEKMPVGL